MRLFGRKKQAGGVNTSQQNGKYLINVNVKDKKFRRYLTEEFDSVVKKEDVIRIMEDLQWESMKKRIENMPPRMRFRVLRYMAQHVNDLKPDVKQNFIRYINETDCVVVEK